MLRTDSNWLQTYTGKQFWIDDPDPDSICIADIAHALAMQCRYNGHCLHFYSVAEHSVWVSRHVPEEFRLKALLHDASEAYLSDIVRPVKPQIKGYVEIEERLQNAIYEKFGLPPGMPPEVKAADNSILVDEKRQLMAPEPAPWHIPYEPLGVEIMGLSPTHAEIFFLTEFQNITGEEA